MRSMVTTKHSLRFRKKNKNMMIVTSISLSRFIVKLGSCYRIFDLLICSVPFNSWNITSGINKSLFSASVHC